MKKRFTSTLIAACLMASMTASTVSWALELGPVKVKTVTTDLNGTEQAANPEIPTQEVQTTTPDLTNIGQMPDIYGVISGFNVIPTGIAANRVINYEGFGSITLNGAEGELDMHGLITRDGNVMFPYVASNYVYQVHDGVISFCGNEMWEDFDNSAPEIFNDGYHDYITMHQPEYYDLNGSRLFERVTLPEVLPEWLGPELDSEQGDPTLITGSHPMIGGYAEVFLDYGTGLWAFIDKTGRVTCFLDDMDEYGFNSNLSNTPDAGWFGDNGWVAYVTHEEYDVYDPELRTEGPKAYLDAHGQKVLDVSALKLWGAWPFSNGTAIVQARDDKYGVIDTNGNFVLPCIYEELVACPGSADVFSVRQGDKWGYIDRNGQTIIPCIYDEVYGWADGVGAVVLNGKCGLVNVVNNIILPLEYDDITDFNGGVCYAVKDGQLYLITR